jgi:hypothetical protein
MSLTLCIVGSVVFALFVAVGLLVAWSNLLPLIGLGALVAFSALGVRHEERRRTARSRRGSARYAATIVAGIVLIPYAAVGMTTLLGGSATALVGTGALAYYGYRRWRRGSAPDATVATGRSGSPEINAPGDGATTSDHPSGASERHGAPRAGPSDAVAADTRSPGLLPADPTGLSIDELCRAWRLSYLVLQNACAAEAERTVQLRCRYLDELARRHPKGFRRWLDDGARAAGDPSRYVREKPARRRHDDTNA